LPASFLALAGGAGVLATAHSIRKDRDNPAIVHQPSTKPFRRFGWLFLHQLYRPKPSRASHHCFGTLYFQDFINLFGKALSIPLDAWQACM
jgi:hypothetical protein